MTRWEYGLVTFATPAELPQILANAGSDGWELITLVNKTLIFKRPYGGTS